jgi:hypothetical protein
VPDDIDRAVQQALEAVRSHSDHWLLPAQRLRLYTLLDGDKTAHTGAHVRAWLDLFSVEHVLPLWQPVPGGLEDETDVLMLMPNLTGQVLRGADPDVLKADLSAGRPNAELYILSVSELASKWGEVSDFSGDTPDMPHFNTWCVFEGALTALDYALGYDHFAYGLEYLTDSTTMITTAYGDAANYAVIAYAGGVWGAEPPTGFVWTYPWTPEGYWNYDLDEVRARRQVFWEWWLLEAMPRARAQAQQYR